AAGGHHLVERGRSLTEAGRRDGGVLARARSRLAVASGEPAAEQRVPDLVLGSAAQQRGHRRIRIEAGDDGGQPREPARRLVLHPAAKGPRFACPAPDGFVHQPETPPAFSGGFTPASASWALAPPEPAAEEPALEADLSEPCWLDEVVEQHVPPS